MSRRIDFAALQEIRSWDVDAVVLALEKNGLGECASAVRKRGINGDSLLDLTEIKLAVWKRDLTLVNIRKLSAFVQDLNKDPGRYLLTDDELSQISTRISPQVKKETVNPASLKGLLPARSASSSSHSSWGSDFDEDSEDGQPGKHENSTKKESEWHTGSTRSYPENTSTSNMRKKFGSQNGPSGQTITRVPTKLTIPNAFASKPDVTAPKPKVPMKFPSHLKTTNSQLLKHFQSEEKPAISSEHTEPSPLSQKPEPAVSQGKANLPKPPASMQGAGNVQNLISNLNFQEDICDDGYYGCYDGETCPDMMSTPSQTKVPPGVPSHSFLNQTDSDCDKEPSSESSAPSHIKSRVLNLGTKSPFLSTGPSNQTDDSSNRKIYPNTKFPQSSAPNPVKSHILNLGTKLLLSPSGAPKLAAPHRSPSPNNDIPRWPSQNNDNVPSDRIQLLNTSQPPRILFPKPTNFTKETIPIQPSSTVLQEPYQEEQYEVFAKLEDGYESEEYESIQEHENHKLCNGSQQVSDSLEDYLQPMTNQTKTASSPAPPIVKESQSVAPPLPAKPRPLLPDLVTPPVFRPASPTKSKSEDSGSSGDGVTGRIGGLFRKRREVKEKSPTPETKKTATPPVPNHKPPPPPPIEQRPPPVSSTQGRPLPQPPVADPSQKNAAGSTRRTETNLPLTSMPWYHNVDRRKAEAMLKNGEDGAFMIRPSTHATNPLTLTLWYNDRFYHISVRHRHDGRYALGTEKANEQSFPSLEELVVSYRSEKLNLYSGGTQTGTTILTSTPRKETSK